MTFRIDAVYQRTVAELEARGLLWAIFTPLAVDADPVRMKEVLGRLRAASNVHDFGELAAALTVVATKDKRQRGLREVILSVLTEEDVMQSSVFQMGERRGELKGKLEGKVESAVRRYERRIQRPLTDDERDALAQRAGKLGGDRVLDAVLDLPLEALAAWLSDPCAS